MYVIIKKTQPNAIKYVIYNEQYIKEANNGTA